MRVARDKRTDGTHVASASGNPIVTSLVEMVSALYYERRRRTAAQASNRDLRDAAEAHRRIYRAIRARDADEARRAMNEHLVQASAYQAAEAAAAATRVRVKTNAAKSKA
jgi:GntR family transcriptional repressor for pyruvate dehydrogenase complex